MPRILDMCWVEFCHLPLLSFSSDQNGFYLMVILESSLPSKFRFHYGKWLIVIKFLGKYS